MGAVAVSGVVLAGLAQQRVDVEVEAIDVGLAARAQPTGQDLRRHLGVELHGEISTDHEGLG